MRGALWATSGCGYDVIIWFMEFESAGGGTSRLKELVRKSRSTALVQAPPEVMGLDFGPGFMPRDENADYYLSVYDHHKQCFRPLGWYENYQRMIVTDYAWFWHTYDLSLIDHQVVEVDSLTNVIVAAIRDDGLKLKNWKVRAGQYEGGSKPEYVAEGDLQALIEYLELDK